MVIGSRLEMSKSRASDLGAGKADGMVASCCRWKVRAGGWNATIVL